MSLTSVLIRLSGRPDGGEAEVARRALAPVAGVARIDDGLKLRNLLFVHYDPRLVSAQALHEALRHHGLAPKFVGS